MIVEERIYTLHTGKTPEFLHLVESEGLAILVGALGNLVGYFATEAGELDQVVHLWAYESMAQREERRAALAARPEYKAYVAKVAPLIRRRESRILIPARFNTLPLMQDAGSA